MTALLVITIWIVGSIATGLMWLGLCHLCQREEEAREQRKDHP